MEKGTFREDLFYRLNVVQIDLPALRNRREDIAPLARFFTTRFAEEYHKPATLSPEALAALEVWDYPGNVRELQNIVERAVALSSGPSLVLEDLPDRVRIAATATASTADLSFPPDGVDIDDLLNQLERKWLLAALEGAGGNKTRAAQLLNITFRSFRYRLAKHGMGGDEL